MARKGESIFLRKDGRYEARYVKGYTSDNKIIYGYIYDKNYSSVKKKRNELLLSLNKNELRKHKDKNNNDINSLIDSWLLQKKLTIKESSYSRYLDIVNNHIRPELGKLNKKQLNENVISDFIIKKINNGNLITNKKLSSKTVKDIVTILKQIIKYGNININICSPKIVKKQIKILEIEEQKRLEFYILNNLNNITIGILISLYMGLRIGEVCALKWKNIDLENKRIHVNHTIIRIKDLSKNTPNKTKVIIEEPKTDNSKRIIPIPPTIIPFLKFIKNKNTDDNNFVLTNNSKFIEPRNYYNKYKKIMKQISIENYDFHSLRHTFATRCIELGFDPKTLSEILGHSDIKITLSLYVHPTNLLKVSCMEKLNLVEINSI